MAIRNDISIDWDASPRIILIDAPSTEVDIQDLIDTLRYLESKADAMDNAQVLDAAGKESLKADGSLLVGLTVTLNNAQVAFEARGGPDWVLCTIAGGNVVAVEDLEAQTRVYIDARKPTAYISIDRTGSSSATLIQSESSVTQGDIDNIVDGVWDESLASHMVPNSASTAVRAATYSLGTITLDTVNGTDGTGWPIGTHFKPSGNLTDALTLMFYGNVDDLVLHSDLIVEASHDISNIVIRTTGKMGTDVTLNPGCTCSGTSFRNINLEGTITSGDQILIYDSSISSLANFQGIMNNVTFAQGSEISLNSWANIIQGTAGGEPSNEVEISIGDASLNMSHWTGNLKLKDKTGSDRTVVNCTSGSIIIDATCVAGIIQLLGTGVIESDNSGPGCQVDIDGFTGVDNIINGVWNELTSEHTIPGTFGYEVEGTTVDLEYLKTSADSTEAIVQFISDLESGKHVLVGNQLICYKPDNVTELIRFNLYDAGGTPTTDNVYQRDRV